MFPNQTNHLKIIFVQQGPALELSRIDDPIFEIFRCPSENIQSDTFKEILFSI